MKPPRPIQSDGKVHGVVAAIHRPADDKWLMIRRSYTVAAPGKICFPGGTVELNESLQDALAREMREELGAEIRPVKQCWRWESPDKPLVLFGWIAELLSDKIRIDPQEVAEYLWLTASEAVEHPDAMPSNRSFVACLLREVAKN
jgi:8-oxo-dGTP pyrophosphatase MutT (NUDIX family)